MFTRYKSYIPLASILILALFLYTYRLAHTMQFFGDVGWYYLDARDLLLGNSFPLVGITSSHPWLHQGAYWTYFLAGVLFFGKLNPLAGGYLAAGIGVGTVAMCYFVGKQMFTERGGVLFALLYTLSPLAIWNMRFPFHTTPIPFLALLFLYLFYSWIQGNHRSFIGIAVVFALLYNFELASIMFIFPLGIAFLYGIWKQTAYSHSLQNKKIVGTSLVGMITTMLPMLIYDIQHGFPQTIRFAMWLLYRLLATIHIIPLHAATPEETWNHFFHFILTNISRIFFLIQPGIAGILLIVVLLFLFQHAVSKRNLSHLVLSLMTYGSLFVFILYKTPSEAYITLFFPFLLFSLAVTLDELQSYKKIGVMCMLFLGFLGAGKFVSQDFTYDTHQSYNFSFDERRIAVDSIIQKVGKNTYTIEGKNMFIPTPAYVMGYEYMLWYLGHPVAEEFPEKIFTIEETPDKIVIEEK